MNDSKRTLYVDLDEPHSVTGVKPGDEGRYPITRCSVRVTISYYSENKEMVYLCTKHILKTGQRLCVSE